MTYKGCVMYKNSCEKYKYTCEQGGFETVEDATMWVGAQFAYLMLNCGNIDEYGIIVDAEVCDEGGENSIGFTDCYSLRCGC